jgi:hypothetical protein
VELNRKAGQNLPRVVAPIKEIEEKKLNTDVWIYEILKKFRKTLIYFKYNHNFYCQHYTVVF